MVDVLASAAPKIHLVENRLPKPTGAVIEEAPALDPGDIQTSVGDDGSVTVTVGSTKPPPAPQAAADDFDANLAIDMDPNALSALAGFLLDGIEADLQSRKDWEDTANRAADYLGIKLTDPSTSVSADGTVCKAVATCLLEANVKSWSTARAELLPVGGPVKVRRENDLPTPARDAETAGTGAPPPNQDELANALEQDFNHYLTVTDREYYPDYSKMLFSRALIGNAFRKVYRCPLRRRPVSVWVRAQDLIVSNDCSHLAGAGRVTERIRLRQSTMRRLQIAGFYRDIALVQPTGQTTETEIAIAETEGIAPAPQLPSDYEHQVYECYCEVGSSATASMVGDLSALDKDETGTEPGYPLPYRVSIDVDSREVLEIRRHWKKGDPDHRARRRYVKYGFIPGLGFMDFGLIHLVGNPTQAATMLLRSSVDSGLFSNFPGGVYLKGPGSRQANTVIRPNPGEFQGMDAAGASRIQDVMMPMPYKQPSPEMIALQTKFEGDSRRLAGIVELPVGEGRIGNTPVGTIMSYIEAVSQVPSAVHKDDHIAQQDEFEMLRELFAEDPDALIRGNKTPARRWQTAQEILDPDLVPAADPNTPSTVHRLSKLQGLVTAAGLPQFQGIANQRAIWDQIVRLLAGGNPQEFTQPPAAPAPPAPDPKIVAASMTAHANIVKAEAGVQEAQIRAQSEGAVLAQESIEREADRQSDEARAALTLKGTAMKTNADTANANADRAQDHAHHLDNMASKPPPFAGPFTGGP